MKFSEYLTEDQFTKAKTLIGTKVRFGKNKMIGKVLDVTKKVQGAGGDKKEFIIVSIESNDGKKSTEMLGDLYTMGEGPSENVKRIINIL